MANTFEIDVSDYLGTNYNEYINDIKTLAITQPSAYANLRKGVIQDLKVGLLSECYKKYYNLLTTGSDFSSLGGREPSYPKQKASEFALKATKQLNEILDEALAIVLPKGSQDFAHLQNTLKAVGEAIN